MISMFCRKLTIFKFGSRVAAFLDSPRATALGPQSNRRYFQGYADEIVVSFMSKVRYGFAVELPVAAPDFSPIKSGLFASIFLPLRRPFFAFFRFAFIAFLLD